MDFSKRFETKNGTAVKMSISLSKDEISESERNGMLEEIRKEMVEFFTDMCVKLIS